MNGFDRRLGRVEAVQRPRHPILLVVERTPSGDVLAAAEARAAAEGRRLLVVATGVCRTPGDPMGAAA